ncbi:MAG: glycoside hydrolase family 16 protein [Acidimicrobiales bacterium]
MTVNSANRRTLADIVLRLLVAAGALAVLLLGIRAVVNGAGTHGPAAEVRTRIAVPAGNAGPASNGSDVRLSGMHLVFHATFQGSSLDPAIWTTCYPWDDTPAGCTNYGNPEFQWFLPAQAQVAHGALRLVASREPTHGYSATGKPEVYGWRSGMVTTYGSFSFTYGYVQFRARLASGAGFWSALWMLPANLSWPPEIDVAEVLGGNPTQPSYFYHPPGAPTEGGSPSRPSANLSKGWHTFGVDWRPGSITWYTDGHRVYQYRGPTPSTPMYLLADLAVSWGISSSSPPHAALYIKSVRVYQSLAASPGSPR